MVNCITRYDMKFGDYFIPARTKAVVINKLNSTTVDAPGVWLKISVNLFDMFPEEKKMKGIPANLTQINNELEIKSYGDTSSQLVGITITTNATQVYLDAGARHYEGVTLYDYQVKKIFNGSIPENIKKNGHSVWKTYKDKYDLSFIIEYLEEEFAEWVQQNCQFRTLTEDDIENGIGFDGAEPGDTILSEKGYTQFSKKQLEYMKRLEVTGFTYSFGGGLIWD